MSGSYTIVSLVIHHHPGSATTATSSIVDPATLDNKRESKNQKQQAIITATTREKNYNSIRNYEKRPYIHQPFRYSIITRNNSEARTLYQRIQNLQKLLPYFIRGTAIPILNPFNQLI